jgi:23S rRNA (cytosine1962-C5)-methyltransferase
MITIHLKKGREKPVRAGHPWIFSGAIAKIDGRAAPGDLCTVESNSGETLGCGYYNPASAISVRMLSIGATLFTESDLTRRMDRAIDLRKRLFGDAKTNAFRVINSEGDFLPGIIVDKYGEGLCIQILTAGMEHFRQAIIARLQSALSPAFIFERSDTESRAREGLDAQEGLAAGQMPESPEFIENGLRFGIDLSSGQKTGFFLDQRDNRRLVGTYAPWATVCDLFAYSGGFSAYAWAQGARAVQTVDISKSALMLAKKNLSLNALPCSDEQFIAADVFSYLRRDVGPFDLIILDPPKFAKHPGEVEQAARGYKDINLLAFKRAAPGALVFTFSCSNAVDRKLFRQIVFSAAADSGRAIQVLRELGAGPDHPVNIAHREGDYLKGLALRVE